MINIYKFHHCPSLLAITQISRARLGLGTFGLVLEGPGLGLGVKTLAWTTSLDLIVTRAVSATAKLHRCWIQQIMQLTHGLQGYYVYLPRRRLPTRYCVRCPVCVCLFLTTFVPCNITEENGYSSWHHKTFGIYGQCL